MAPPVHHCDDILEGTVNAVQGPVHRQLQLTELLRDSIVGGVEVLDAQVCLEQEYLRHSLDGDGKGDDSVLTGPTAAVISTVQAEGAEHDVTRLTK